MTRNPKRSRKATTGGIGHLGYGTPGATHLGMTNSELLAGRDAGGDVQLRRQDGELNP